MRLVLSHSCFTLPAGLLLAILAAVCGSPPSRAVLSSADSQAAQARSDAKGVEQVWAPAGSFMMGADEASLERLKALNPPAWVAQEFESEKAAHEARLTAGFWIDKYEVTNRSFRAFVTDGGYRNHDLWSAAGWDWLSRQSLDKLPRSCQGDPPDNPVVCVTWYEAEAYAAWRGGRLPTEAQWEYAARGPQSLIYPWGNEFDAARCNVVDSKGLKPVGSYPNGVSWVGAYDMAGNAMEWVQDWLAPHPAGPVVDPSGPPTGKVKIEKGGWWGGPALAARSSYRHFEDPPEYGDHHIGFRVVSQ